MTANDLLDAPAPAATDQESMKVHLRCRWCEPVWRLGMAAVCGEKMLGIPLPRGQANVCAECKQGECCGF